MSPVNSEEDLVACIVEVAAPGIFEGTCQSLLDRHWLCIKVDGHALERLL
jgi:hypothetical protein